MTTTSDTNAPDVIAIAADAERRSAYTAGLRALADLLDSNSDLPLPYDGISSPISVFVYKRAQVAAFAKLLPGKVDKEYDAEDSTFGFRLRAQLGGVALTVIAPRAEVCERVVTGIREVTREIPDPVALAAVPTTTVTETVEDVEWVCTPLLADERVPA